ncbi:type VI secretion IcmF C-terminal domain-containing protein, partial [Pseudomonas putida]|uniref:type VI secretion IcmF C-terminal domain-containing protein n=1 Tax=Pseudomonas putida TaxID=303 RepID=UPI002950048E
PQLLVTKSAIRPGSNFNRQGGSIFHQRQHDHPGISLTWSSVYTGERLFADYQGTWGLIRLLEQANVTALDDGDSRFRVVLDAPDGLRLTWHLRTELGEGPLALLKLRGFSLPREIFLVDGRDTPQYAQNGGIE